jgi:ribokinase
MAPRVIVVGSVNVDLVATVDRLPVPGQTVTGGTFARHHGGKGGNQATAAARLGSDVAFVGAVGDDPFADEALAALESEGVDVTELARLDGPTGVALILVDANGENLIAVASGANGLLSAGGVAASLRRLSVGADDVVVVSNEIPGDAVLAALRSGHAAGATTILNPAPATGLGIDAIRSSDVVVPNEGELAELVAVLDRSREGPAGSAATDVVGRAVVLLAPSGGGTRGGRSVIVTRGRLGAVLVRDDRDSVDLPPPDVAVVDATGAGDAFVGALAAGLARGCELEAAARRAVAAASLSTTKRGARGGMPTAAELDTFIDSL